MPLSSTQNLSTIDCGLVPNFGRYALPSLWERHSRVEFCPTHIPLAPAGLWPSPSYTLAVCTTRSACRSNRQMYFVRERRSTGISHHQFAMLIGETLDERKMSVCDERRSFGVPCVRDVVAEHHRPQIWKQRESSSRRKSPPFRRYVAIAALLQAKRGCLGGLLL